MTAEHYHALHSWMDAHPTAKRCVVALDRWLPLIPFVCYPVLLCLLNVRLFRLLGSQRQAALDLTAVMSSLLGRSGGNLRAALDFAKRSPCVLLLDEIDAIAKRRSDDTDIGELKRLVTVILQEVDEWPATGLLLAATNHAELIDPALWRRFDLVINFKAPEMPAVKQAIKRFLGPDYALFGRWIDILTFAFNGESFSDIERDLQRFRRAVALGTASDADLIEEFVKSRALVLERQGRIDLAVLLAKQTRLSQHTISDITGVSRDTIRKYTSEQPVAAKKTSKGKPEA